MQLSGSNLAFYTKNITFNGFNQKVQVDTSGKVTTNYIVLDSDNSGSQLYQTYLVDLKSGVLRFAGRSINFPGGSPPPSDSSCWFDKKAICSGGMKLPGVCVNVVNVAVHSLNRVCRKMRARVLSTFVRLPHSPHRQVMCYHPQVWRSPTS